MNIRLGSPPDVTLPSCLMPLQITALSGVRTNCTGYFIVHIVHLVCSKLVFFPNPDILKQTVAQERLVACDILRLTLS
jgi:hypothetical protein